MAAFFSSSSPLSQSAKLVPRPSLGPSLPEHEKRSQSGDGSGPDRAEARELVPGLEIRPLEKVTEVRESQSVGLSFSPLDSHVQQPRSESKPSR